MWTLLNVYFSLVIFQYPIKVLLISAPLVVLVNHIVYLHMPLHIRIYLLNWFIVICGVLPLLHLLLDFIIILHLLIPILVFLGFIYSKPNLMPCLFLNNLKSWLKLNLVKPSKPYKLIGVVSFDLSRPSLMSVV